MYFAKSIEEHRMETFRILLARTLEGFNGYKKEIEVVLTDAKDLSEGKKTLYTIDKENFPLIIYLNEYGKPFLQKINDVHQLKTEDYNQLLKIFDTNLELCE